MGTQMLNLGWFAETAKPQIPEKPLVKKKPHWQTGEEDPERLLLDNNFYLASYNSLTSHFWLFFFFPPALAVSADVPHSCSKRCPRAKITLVFKLSFGAQNGTQMLTLGQYCHLGAACPWYPFSGWTRPSQWSFATVMILWFTVGKPQCQAIQPSLSMQ